MQYILKIKDLEVPFCIKNYKTAKTMKIYFKEDGLVVTKSPYVLKREVDKFIKQNEEKIYEEYKRIEEKKHSKVKRWMIGQSVLYKGENYNIDITYHEKNRIVIKIDEENKIFKIIISNKISKDEEEIYIKKAVKKLFKENTEKVLKERLDYLSMKTNISYNSVKVSDAKTKYGSCTPKTKALHFSSRLIMLKKEAIDAVIIHELCHIVHPNHSKDFYNLVENYIPNYKDISKYLKSISKLLII